MRSIPKGIAYRFCVCPVCTCVNKVNTKVPEGGSPLCAGSYPEALASRKLVCRETCSEESETAKLGSNEQELNKRLVKPDEVAHHTEVQRMPKA